MEIVVKSQKNSGTNKSHVRKTIFVVEDDQDLFSLIQKKLQHAGLRTEGALTGSEAIAKISKNPPTLVLLDYITLFK